MPDRQIYLLSPRELSPETIAVAFAKTSRSPESFRDIAAGLTEEKSAQFHEKWVVGYGHASVAEHAVLHIAFENISRLSVESIESNRLASYTEKSTRYQKWNPDDFHVPTELSEIGLRDDYIALCRLLFDTYRQSLEPLRQLVGKSTARREHESDESFDRRVRSQYVDVARFLLPAASLANVGMTVNARALENVIRKMLSHQLAEVREIGAQVKDVARNEVPTLVKYAEAVPYLSESTRALEQDTLMRVEPAAPPSAPADWCNLIDYDADGENMVLAAALYRTRNLPITQALEYVRGLSQAERSTLADAILGRLEVHDVPMRELEYSTYTFDLVMDQGAYAEFKRHRMMTQTSQKLTTRLGYSLPRSFVEAGLQSTYAEAMSAAAELYERLSAFDPYVAQYVVPNGFHRRVLARFNLREAYAFCELRSAANAHFSIRKVAGRIAEEIQRVHPLLSGYMRLAGETSAGINASFFAEVGAGS